MGRDLKVADRARRLFDSGLAARRLMLYGQTQYSEKRSARTALFDRGSTAFRVTLVAFSYTDV